MAARLQALSRELCDGRLTLFLEGGYDLQALSEAAESVSGVLDGTRQAPAASEQTTRGGAAVTAAVASAIAPFWPGIPLAYSGA